MSLEHIIDTSDETRATKMEIIQDKLLNGPEDLRLSKSIQMRNSDFESLYRKQNKHGKSTMHSVSSILMNNQATLDTRDEGYVHRKPSRTMPRSPKKTEDGSLPCTTSCNSPVNLSNDDISRTTLSRCTAKNITIVDRISHSNNYEKYQEEEHCAPLESTPGEALVEQCKAPGRGYQDSSPTRRRVRLAFSIDRIMEPSPKKTKLLKVGIVIQQECTFI